MSGTAILVVIPTTRGPLCLRGLSPRPGLPAPAAFADGDYRPLPWSADYARLCAPGGPVARLGAEAGAPHELRLSGSFDAGRSWEVPVCLAHGLAARGHRFVAEPVQADLILWATGAVDRDLAVLPGDYALLDKIERSRTLLAEVPEVPLAVLLPEGPERAPAEAAFLSLARAETPQILPAGHVPAAVEALTGPKGADRPDPRRHWRRVALPAGAAAAAGLVGLAGFMALAGRQAPVIKSASDPAAVAVSAEPVRTAETDPPSPSASEKPIAEKTAAEKPAAIRVEELRAPPGSSCRRVAFGADPPERRAVAPEGAERLAPTRLVPELCGLAIAAAPGLRLEIGPELRAAALPPVRLADGAQGFYLREGGRHNLVYAVHALPEAKARPEAGAAPPGERLVHALTR
ncbi:hypothetical protein MPPM_0823 [Methylorubrum populi]|uniref:Uncharacterized protein n=1 Tax=Methylorubrum populi TaxID=223967 RepID=A0A169QPM3_9HYPH|nr:hypothetical protein [Methylorubrum populi]BAU89428.1 hypothetical protein MPPM_0823 [Methylorubrum populi]